MQRIRTLFALFVAVFYIQSTWAQENIEMNNPIPSCQKLIREGLYKDALDKLKPWVLDSNNIDVQDKQSASEAIRLTVDCLSQLNRIAEVDDFLEQAAEVRADDWRSLQQIAQGYTRGIASNGNIVDGKFRRGNRDGQGQWANSRQRDRVRALQLCIQAMPLAEKDDNKSDVAAFFSNLAARFYTGDWKMQILTDLSMLPDYDTERWYGGGISDAPVDVDGNPVFYGIPESFESAKNDGERWRWSLQQAVENNPDLLAETLFERARFSQSQFGEQTLQSFPFFRSPQNGDETERQANIWNLESLSDNETIAKLATGIKRFELPDEFNYIKLYQEIIEKGDDDDKIRAYENLSEIAQNRMQYEKAAEYLITLREKFPNVDAERKERWKNQYDQIVGNWGRLEPTSSEVAGTDATLGYVFRNGNRVKLSAHEIKIPALLEDIKAYLKSKPDKLDWSRTNIEQIGYQLIQAADDASSSKYREKYLGAKVADWTVELEPAEKHFDRKTLISVPIQKAGAYLVQADMTGGNTEYVVLWLTDTAIVQKQLDGTNLYFLADAETGQPIAEANLDFFAYKTEWTSEPRSGGRRQQANQMQWTFNELKQKTDENGLTILQENVKPDGFNWLITLKNDKSGRFAYLGFNNIWFNRRYDEQYNEVKTFFISDRPVYRPGDRVEMKIWVGTAKYDSGETSEWSGKTVSYEIYDPKGEKIAEQSDMKLDAYGGATFNLDLPKDATLGNYSFQLNDPGGHGTFRVEEYKKPEYEVSVDAPKDPVRLGEKIKAKITAKYYFGSPVTEATVKYKVLREKHDEAWFPWRPWDWFYGSGYGWLAYDTDWLPGWNRWGIGRPRPSWFPYYSGPPEVVAEQEVKIGEDGTVEIEIDSSLAEAMFPGESQRYSISAEVVDNSRRTIVGSGSVLVSKEPFKVYSWVDRGYYQPGQKIEAGFQARRLDGKPVSGDAEVKVYQISYKEPDAERSEASGFEAQEKEVHSATIQFDDEGKANLSLNAAEPGQYRISCKLDGQEGGYVFNVYSNDNPEAPLRCASGSLNWKFNALELIPDKSEFKPGENVALKVNSDRENAFVLLFVKAANGVCLKPQILRLNGKSSEVAIPVELRDMPNFFVEALLVSDGRVVTEVREIAVPPEQKVFNVEVKPSAENYKPGEKAKAELIVTDLDGVPASGQIVVSIYDKSVEYISGGSNVGDIKEFFWRWRRQHHPQSVSNLEKYFGNMQEPNKPGMQNLGVFGHMTAEFSRGVNKATATGGRMARGGMMKAAPMMMETNEMALGVAACDAAAPESGMVPAAFAMSDSSGKQDGGTSGQFVEPTVRKNFADTALWVGALKTDKDGKARIELDMPESLTTWKINVWSMGLGNRVGHGTAEVITRKDLIIRMQTPRFLVEKDRCVFSANVHNYLTNEKEVEVSLDLKNPMQNEAQAPDNPEAALRCASSSLKQTVKIPAGGEARVDWTVEAQAAGDATVTMKALTDEDSDAMQLTLPVYVHGMLKQEAWSGYIATDKDSGSVEIRVPKERKPEQTKLTVRFSPTLAASMIDALPYLVDYPYGCTEQTLNRFLPTVIVQKILIDMNVDLEKLKDLKTNLNAQELGEGRKPAVSRTLEKRKVEPVFDVDEVREMVADGVKKLTDMQCSDGGWGWFGGYGEYSSPHLTALVVRGLLLALHNDVEVDKVVLKRGIDWLIRHQKEELRKLKNGDLPEEERKKLSWNDWKSSASNEDAFVFMVIVQTGMNHKADKKSGEFLGETEEAAAMKSYLWRDRAKLSLYGVAMYGIALASYMDCTYEASGWAFDLAYGPPEDKVNLLSFLSKPNGKTIPADKDDQEKIEACVKMLEQYLVQDEENQTAWLNLGGSSNWFWWSWHGSEFETQAYYLKLLMRTDPKSPVAPRLVKYLLNNRRHATYWNSTRDTAICIEAFAEFLKATSEDKPNMTVEVLLDGQVKKTVEITPKNLFEIDNTLVLNAADISSGNHKIELRKKGEGPLYFNAYLENFTLEDPIEKAGLEVKIERRIYKLVRDESATAQSAGGRGQVVDMKVEKFKRLAVSPRETLQSGDLVEIELVIESKNDYESIIIEDMKAAGLEPVDVQSGYGNHSGGNELGAYVEFRDERVAFFVYRLAKGKHSVSYRLRAEQPGEFSALPAKIEAMYAPELKGNSDENKVKIEDRE